VLAGVVILGTIMTVLDLTVVNVAIPTLASDLSASARRRDDPADRALIDVSLLRRRGFGAAAAVNLLLMVALFGGSQGRMAARMARKAAGQSCWGSGTMSLGKG
jgi:MFS family permease